METYLCLCVTSHLAQRLFTIMEKCFQFECALCLAVLGRLRLPHTETVAAAEVVVAALRLMMRKWNGSNNIPIHARTYTHCRRQVAPTPTKKEGTKQNKSYARETCDAGAQISVMVAAATVAAVDKLARMSIFMLMCVRSVECLYIAFRVFVFLSLYLCVCRALKCMKPMHDFSRNHTIVQSDDDGDSSSSLAQPHNHFRHAKKKKSVHTNIEFDLNVSCSRCTIRRFGAWDLLPRNHCMARHTDLKT